MFVCAVAYIDDEQLIRLVKWTKVMVEDEFNVPIALSAFRDKTEVIMHSVCTYMN